MTLHQGVLHVATTRGRFTWPLSGPVRGQGMPLDGGGVFEEIRAFYSDGDRLHTAWRTHLEPEGPGEVSALVRARGELWAGTLEGRLLRVGGDVERTFSGPVRHLLATPDALLVAAGGALHRFDGSWTQTEGEPYALALHRGQVCTLHRGRLSIDGALDPTPLNRPWCLASTEQGLFVGCVGGLVLR